MPYHDVPPRSIAKTLLSTVTHYLVDLTTKSRLVVLEAASPISKDGASFNTTEVEVSIDYPHTFEGVKGFLSITSFGSFRVIVVDVITGEAVNFYVDKVYTFHGICDNRYIVQTDDANKVKVTVLRAC